MRRRLTFLWTLLVLGLALMLPATTLGASPYVAKVIYNGCTLSGGAHGYGWVDLTVQARENGWSGTNYFIILSKLQTGPSPSGPWYTELNWDPEYSSWFKDNRTNHYRNVDRYFDFDESSTSDYHRIVIKVQFWSDYGLIRTKTVKGYAC